MKIKGIDLYKRVLEEDETILGKVFEFDDMKIRVVNTFGNLSNEWGLTEDDSKYGSHILYNLSKRQIDEIFKAEWSEVRQAVEPHIAIKEFMENRTPFTIEMPNGDAYFQLEQNKLGLLEKGVETIFGIDSLFIKNGKWYIED